MAKASAVKRTRRQFFATGAKRSRAKRRRRTLTLTPLPQSPKPTEPPPQPPREPLPGRDEFVYSDPFGREQAYRLLWRAGFGPRPGEADELAASGDVIQAVVSLTRPEGGRTLLFNPPHERLPLAPGTGLVDPFVRNNDQIHWLDQMVRSSQSLVERMTLVWHDWFATQDSIGTAPILDQIQLFRQRGLGSFRDLVEAVTQDPAMLAFLNGAQNERGDPNENYARELMELFTLGADRGAYTEDDVKEAAKALTGLRLDPSDATRSFFDPTRWEPGDKSIFPQLGFSPRPYEWVATGDLCVTEHPMHAEFFVRKLWSYFIPSPPSDETREELERRYRASFSIREIVEAILLHPDLYLGAAMIKPPAVLAAGMMRATARTVQTENWAEAEQLPFAGQQLLAPPNVAGWNDERWLNTSTFRHRWNMVGEALRDIPAPNLANSPEEAVTAAIEFWGRPPISQPTRDALLAFAALPIFITDEDRRGRHSALRYLVAGSPDFQVC